MGRLTSDGAEGGALKRRRPASADRRCGMTEVVSAGGLSAFQQLTGLLEDIFHGKAEVFEQRRRRGRFAKAGHADYATFQADILVPVISVGSLDSDTRANLYRQNRLLVASILGIKHAG